MHYLPDYYYIVDEADKLNASGPFHIDCAFCDGTGVHPATMKLLNHSKCPSCKGEGLFYFTGSPRDYIPCPVCQNTGRDADSNTITPCGNCGGVGIIKLPDPILSPLPPPE